MLRRKTPETQENQPSEPLFKAPAILSKLNAAEANLASLSAKYDDAALEGVLTNNEDALASLKAEMTRARERVETLTAAYTGAEKADAETRRADMEARNQGRIKSARASLAIADKATEDLAEALSQLIKNYQIILEQRMKIKAFFPGEITLLDAMAVERHVIRDLLALEMERLSPNPKLGEGTFLPAPKADPTHIYRHDAIKPLTEKLKDANEHIFAAMTGKTAN